MRAASALLLLLVPSPVLAETVVLSEAPVSTSVTVYRDGDRERGAFDLRWLQGYALISEKRRILLPAGPSTVRFEGVADGMIAVSAVVSGLPGGVDEKNRDARLLSPASLLDGTLGNRLHVRRTNPGTGKVTESDAIVRSGPQNAVVLETAEGIEALRCSGLPETLVYGSVPEGLSAKPTFSVHTDSPRATEAEVTLTYLATGFDWGANYVATVAEDGKTLDLFAWLTVANGNGATYEGTELLAIAGRPNRTSDFLELAGHFESPVLNLQCWPMDSTSTRPGWGEPPPAPPPAPIMLEMAAPMAARAADAGNIIVTAQKVMAQQEDLGDLKLYRVPIPVDVVPNGQKQVALLDRKSVPFRHIYTASVAPWSDESEGAFDIVLRAKNEKGEGLGVPLPAGGIVTMQREHGEEMLLADGDMADKGVGEKVEIGAGTSDQLRYSLKTLSTGKDGRNVRIILTNALDFDAPVEVRLPRFGNFRLRTSQKVATQGNESVISLTVPANGERRIDLDYTER
ncbi:MAG: DUF4139 domain-containing protein [Sphingobium sp.]